MKKTDTFSLIHLSKLKKDGVPNDETRFGYIGKPRWREFLSDKSWVVNRGLAGHYGNRGVWFSSSIDCENVLKIVVEEFLKDSGVPEECSEACIEKYFPVLVFNTMSVKKINNLLEKFSDAGINEPHWDFSTRDLCWDFRVEFKPHNGSDLKELYICERKCYEIQEELKKHARNPILSSGETSIKWSIVAEAERLHNEAESNLRLAERASKHEETESFDLWVMENNTYLNRALKLAHTMYVMQHGNIPPRNALRILRGY